MWLGKLDTPTNRSSSISMIVVSALGEMRYQTPNLEKLFVAGHGKKRLRSISEANSEPG
jgi:hypothetical protein